MKYFDFSYPSFLKKYISSNIIIVNCDGKLYIYIQKLERYFFLSQNILFFCLDDVVGKKKV